MFPTDQHLGCGPAPASTHHLSEAPGKGWSFLLFSEETDAEVRDGRNRESRLGDSQACASGPLTSHPQGLGFLGSTLIWRVSGFCSRSQGSLARHSKSKYLTVDSEKVKMLTVLPPERRPNGQTRTVFHGPHRLAEQGRAPRTKQDLLLEPQNGGRTSWVERGAVLLSLIWGTEPGREARDGRGARRWRSVANSQTLPREDLGFAQMESGEPEWTSSGSPGPRGTL